MTTQEFSNQFDVLYNNVTSNQAPGLSEYEKSVFLTKAQEEIVKNYFNPKANPKQDGFDDSPKRQADFSSIIAKNTLGIMSGVSKFDQRSIAYVMPSDLFICLNEQLMDGTTPITVVPISYGEYDRLMSKPYKYPPKFQAWRLITQNSATTSESVTVSTQFGNYGSLILVSSYPKPVRMMLKTVEVAASPTVEETPSLVTITCHLSIYQDSSTYWNNYLKNSDAIEPYLGDFSGAEGHSTFPYFPSSVLQQAGLNATIADLTNPGGTPTGTINIAEIIGRFKTPVPTYNMRYIKRPRPIILVSLNDGSGEVLTIQGEWQAMTSELSEELHEEILQRAVELAKIAWTATGQDNMQAFVQAGQRSE